MKQIKFCLFLINHCCSVICHLHQLNTEVYRWKLELLLPKGEQKKLIISNAHDEFVVHLSGF